MVTDITVVIYIEFGWAVIVASKMLPKKSSVLEQTVCNHYLDSTEFLDALFWLYKLGFDASQKQKSIASLYGTENHIAAQKAKKILLLQMMFMYNDATLICWKLRSVA